MKILVTNDDGIFAEGIRFLALALKRAGHTVMIAAPLENQSCIGHSLTLRRPLYVKKYELAGLEDVPCYSVSGTPVDCVRLSTGNLGFEPELIVSGINHASNLGTDTLYSGTVSAALEGAIMGYPALAVSKDTFTVDHMEDAAQCFTELLPELIDMLRGIGGVCVLSVNIPSLPKRCYKGVRTAKLAVQEYEISYDEKEDDGGEPAYFVRSAKLTQCDDMDYDEKCVSEGYVTVTPLTCDLTYYAAMPAVKKLERDW